MENTVFSTQLKFEATKLVVANTKKWEKWERWNDVPQVLEKQDKSKPQIGESKKQ